MRVRPALPALLALLLPALLPAATQRPATPAEEGLTPSAASEADEDEAYRARLRKLRELRDEIREERLLRRKSEGAPNGWALTMGLSLTTNLSGYYYSSLPGGFLLDLAAERSLTEHLSVRMGGSWNPIEDGYYSAAVVWAGRLQLRHYPFRLGRLNGFFLGLGADYKEVRHHVGSAWDPGLGDYRELYRYGHGLGVGPTVGYQFIFGGRVVLCIESNYRYNWVEVPDDAYDYNNYYSPGGGNQVTASTLDSRVSVGWAF